MQDDTLFKNYMTAMGEIFERTITGLLSDTYWQALLKYSDEQCKKGFELSIINCKWFPKPIEIIGFIERGYGDIEDIAIIEADKAVRAIRAIGQYKSVTFDDPVTMAVISQGWGGWIKACDLLVDDIKWFKKDFQRIYKAYANQGIKKYGYLIGNHEDNNLEKWPHKIPPPILIGDEEKAQKVLEHNKPNLKVIESKP